MQSSYRGAFMKIFQKAMDAVSGAAKVICMACVVGIVAMIVAELINRNLLNGSFRASVEICGILFLWMAFIGLIPLYRSRGLMRLDFLVSRIKSPAALDALQIFTYLIGAFLGVVMILAYRAYVPYINNRYYATFTFKLPYTVQYFPMCVAGAYFTLDALGNIIAILMGLAKGKDKEALL